MSLSLRFLIACAFALSATAPAEAGAQEQESPQLSFYLLPDLPDPIGLGGPIVGVHKDALIVGGGANFPTPLAEGGDKVWHQAAYILLPGDTEWRTGQRLPAPLAYAACVSTEKGVLIAGGSDHESVYASVRLMTWDDDRQQLEFRELPDLPEPSAFGSAEAIGNLLFVFGGQRSKDGSDLSGAVWSLDLEAAVPAWKELPSYPGKARVKMVTAAQRGLDSEVCLFLFSGSRSWTNEAGQARFEMDTDGYRYSPSLESWTQIASLPVLDDPRNIQGKEHFATQAWPIEAACAEAYGENEVICFSGSTGRYILNADGELVPPEDRPAFLNRVLAYNTVHDLWRARGEMPIGVVTTEAVQWGERIVIPSGEVKPGIRTPRVQALALPPYVIKWFIEPSTGSMFRILDYLVLATYLGLMVLVGVYFARRETSTEEFFLGGRKIPWWAAGLSIFGTQLSAITFMAIPATAYGSDWRRFAGQIMVLPIIAMVIFCFLPLFRRLNVTTAYEYLEARFSLSVRLFASSLFILFQLGRMGIVLLLPAIALSAVTGIDTYLCIALMGILATAYTTMGGISAVIWTDVLQVFVLIGGALLCLVVAISDAGGIGASIDLAQAAGKFDIFDWRWSSSDMVAWVLIVGFFFTNLVPYTTDQTVIQRYLTTSNEKQAARSLWLNLAITLPTGVLFFGLGTALFVYYTGNPELQAALPQKADQLVPWFVVTHLPAGVAGLVVAGIFAAAMSSLDSSMNSIATAIVNDFVGRFEGPGPKKDRLGLARRLTVLLGIIGTSAAMLLATYEIKYLFDFFQKIMGLFGGGLAGVFLLAVFTKKTHARGALIGLVLGGLSTIGVAFFTEINFLLYAAVGAVVCVCVGYGVSIATGGNQKGLAGLTHSTFKESGHEQA